MATAMSHSEDETSDSECKQISSEPSTSNNENSGNPNDERLHKGQIDFVHGLHVMTDTVSAGLKEMSRLLVMTTMGEPIALHETYGERLKRKLNNHKRIFSKLHREVEFVHSKRDTFVPWNLLLGDNANPADKANPLSYDAHKDRETCPCLQDKDYFPIMPTQSSAMSVPDSETSAQAKQKNKKYKQNVSFLRSLNMMSEIRRSLLDLRRIN